jgi:alpha-D-xyloside xylohydrolase
MQLLPYIYTAFARYQQEGVPPFRAMQLEEGFLYNGKMENAGSASDGNNSHQFESKEIKFQYMMGEAILVAPMFTGEISRRVALPEGKWFDFYTGEFVGEGTWITVTPGLDQIPLFVRDGGIIPMIKGRNRAPKVGEIMQLEIRKYGHAEGVFKLYDDDGTTFDYEKGVFSWSTIQVTLDGNEWKGTLETGNKNAFYYSPDIILKIMTPH